MKKQFINVLLCGAMILSVGIFTSCSEDNDDLKSRLTVVEGAIGELKSQLANALTSGASIISANEENGIWTLQLSDGQRIVIEASTGGGSSVTVSQNETSVTITVNGTIYVIPKGASVNSLIYSPEYTDGMVYLGNDGATVNLLATPAVSAEALGSATFDIAEAHKLNTRAGSDLIKVSGAVTIDGDFLVVPLKGIGVEAGETYAVAIQMTVGGTTISSNYFNVRVSDDFNFISEDIGGYVIKSEYNAQTLADNFHVITINGSTLLNDISDFKSFFTTLPDGSEFRIASKAKQPDGKAQEKWDILNKSLAKDGTWGFFQRPGTSFNDNTTRPGFLFEVVVDDVIKAKIYIVITDELANVDFEGAFTAEAEAEWGGRVKSLALGAQEVKIQATFNNYAEDYPIIHGGEAGFFKQWPDFIVTQASEGDVIYNDGEKLVLGSVGSKYSTGSRGLYWFCRGFAIHVPEALATENGKYIGTDGKSYAGGEGYGYDFWGKQGIDFTDPNEGYMLAAAGPWGIELTQDGILKFPTSYTGYGLRLAIGACYEYAYGVKKIGKEDQFGLFFFNRRLAPTGATMPAPAP